MAVKVKICGLTKEQEVKMLAENHADFGGIVLFFEKSKRNCPIEKAEKLVKLLKTEGIASVAVVVSPTLSQVEQIQSLGFDYLQIHGELKPEVLEQIKIPVIRAFNLTNMAEREALQENGKVAGWLLDAAVPGAGKTFDWQLLKDWKRDDRLFLLAGGLHAGNVREAIKVVQPDVVDVSSGVEFDSEEEIEKNGCRKDVEKVKEFIRQARQC